MKRFILAILFMAAIFCLTSAASAEPIVESTLGIVEITAAEVSGACHIRYTSAAGTTEIDQDGFIQVAQMRGPETPQKSFQISSDFSVRLFSDRDCSSYSSFLLRNSGYDGLMTRILDGYQSRLLDLLHLNILNTAWCPVAVYVNGEYMGHCQLQENPDAAFVASHEGLDLSQAEMITILEGNGTLVAGSENDRADYLALIEKVQSMDTDDSIKLIESEIDTDSYLSYMAMATFVGNSDIGCIRWYRTPGNKWKWLWCNADWGLYNSAYDSPAMYMKSSGMGHQNIDNTLLLKLLSSENYRDFFLKKLGEIYQTLTSETMLSVLEPIVNEISPEMPAHWARWASADSTILETVPADATEALHYWEQRINRLRNTVTKRPGLLWEQIQTGFGLSDDEMRAYLGTKP